MSASISIPENLEVLKQIFEKAKTLFTGSKKKKSKAKKKYKKAENADLTNLELYILKWKYKHAKHKHKVHKAAYKIAKMRLKHATHHAEKAEVNLGLAGESTRVVSDKGNIKKHTKKVEATLIKKDKKHHHKNHKQKEKKAEIKAETKQSKAPEVKVEKKSKKSAKKVAISNTTTTAIVPNKNDIQLSSVVDKVTVMAVPQTMPSITKIPATVSIVQPTVETPTVATANVQQTVETPTVATANVQSTVETTTVTTAVDYSTNDLTLIEGIGKKVAQILNENGIATFTQLSTASVDELKTILRKNRLQMMDPASWAEQAKLIVDGKHDELKHLQEILKGGRRV